jgi:cytochrome c biogenesis protein CcmG/thiol:disulfide interchange protein DsbE
MPWMPSRRVRVPRRTVGTALVVAISFGAAACARPGAEPAAGGGSIRAVNATAAPLLPARADALPSFTLQLYDRLLRELRGTPIVVNMWGSWCAPCATEAPMLAAAHRTYGDRVQFLGIDIEDSVASARAFVRRYGWTFPSIRDPDFPSAFRSGLGFAGQPNTLFYDASGRLVRRWQGPLTDAALRSGIREIVPGPSRPA